MAWIKVNQNLSHHPKLKRLAQRLRVPLAQAAGHLTFLWLWALEYRPSGDLSALEPAEISAAADFGGDPELFCQALRQTGWIDEDNTIHDWEDYTGKFLKERDQAKVRMREWRKKHTQDPDDQGNDGCVTRNKSEVTRNLRERDAIDKSRVDKNNTPLPPKGDPPGPPGGDEDPIPMEDPDSARVILAHLNQKAGREFRPTESNLKLINCRLKEPGVTVDGVKQMIDRQVAMWSGDDLEEYLRPDTLFRASKFGSYYDSRTMPVRRRQRDGVIGGQAVTVTDLRKTIQLIQDQIATHPANKEFIGSVDDPTPEQRTELRQLREKLRQTQEAYTKTISTQVAQ